MIGARRNSLGPDWWQRCLGLAVTATMSHLARMPARHQDEVGAKGAAATQMTATKNRTQVTTGRTCA